MITIKDIAHLAGPNHLSVSQERLRGYQAAIEKDQIPVDENLIIFGEFNEEHGRKNPEKLLILSPKADAIFAVNDPVTIGAFKAVRTNGLHIPEDMAIVGFSDNPISVLIEPALTTVAQPSYEIGKRAARLLIEQVESDHQPLPFQEEILQTQLIIRKST